jgi:hypothetical protein
MARQTRLTVEERMNLDELQSKLLAAGREARPSDAVPYAFEKRIMARLETRARVDPVSLWNRMLWRAAVPCLLVMLSVSLWSFLAQHGDAAASLGAELAEAVFAPAYAAIEESW